jgi:hypothetical protein
MNVSDDPPPISEALRHEILRRAEAYRAHPEDVVPLDEALARIEHHLQRMPDVVDGT